MKVLSLMMRYSAPESISLLCMMTLGIVPLRYGALVAMSKILANSFSRTVVTSFCFRSYWCVTFLHKRTTNINTALLPKIDTCIPCLLCLADAEG